MQGFSASILLLTPKKTHHPICRRSLYHTVRLCHRHHAARLRRAASIVCHPFLPSLADGHGVECSGFIAVGLAADLHARLAAVSAPRHRALRRQAQFSFPLYRLFKRLHRHEHHQRRAGGCNIWLDAHDAVNKGSLKSKNLYSLFS